MTLNSVSSNLRTSNSKPKIRVLEIGGRHRPQAHLLFHDAEIVTLDVNPDNEPDIVADAKDPPKELYGKFDAVFASHVIEHFSWQFDKLVLFNWSRLLKERGELHVITPSLEWAATQILAEDPSPAFLVALYGGHSDPYDMHYTGFTMRRLRKIFEEIGLYVYRAQTGDYKITLDGADLYCKQHYIAGSLYHPPELKKE